MTSTDPATTAYVDSRRIGEAVVTIISEGSCLWAPRFQVAEETWRGAVPEADAEGRIRIWFNLAHIKLGNASIVVDPGFDDPSSDWDRMFGAKWPEYTRTPGLEAALASLGLRPEGITHVLITHGHDDHFAGIVAERDHQSAVRFPLARHVLGRADWDTNPRRNDPASDAAIRLGAVERLGLLDLIDGEREIVSGVTMIPTPGETPGHSAVMVRTGGENFYYAGDLFHHRCEVEHPDWTSPGRDHEAMVASRTRLIAEASENRAAVIFAHERFPGWGRIVPAGSGHRWERT